MIRHRRCMDSVRPIGVKDIIKTTPHEVLDFRIIVTPYRRPCEVDKLGIRRCWRLLYLP